MENEKSVLISEWDKTFPKSKKVNHRKNAIGKLSAIAVCDPFGIIKRRLPK